MKNYLLALLSGVFLAVSWPTYGFPLFLFLAFVPLLLAEHNVRSANNSKRKVFALAYLTFFVFNSCTTWWLYYATPGGMYFAVLANSFLMTLVFFAYHILAKRLSEKLSLIVLVCMWIGFEKFHLNWELSWPWLNLGNGFSEHHTWVQWYEYTGVFGGTLWIWIVNLVVYKAYLEYSKHGNRSLLVKRIVLAACMVIIGIFSSLYLYHTTPLSKESTTVIVLQPNIDPYTEKYGLSNEQMATDLVALANQKMDEDVAFVIAPETTLPRPTLLKSFTGTTAFGTLNSFVKAHAKTSFLSGITFVNTFAANEKPNSTANFYRNSKKWYNSYNSSFFINGNPGFEHYHKSKLVVGVEHIPYRSILNPILKNSMIDLGGSVSTLSTQEYRKVFKNDNHVAAPIICYESVYGEYVTDYVNKGADFLAIITNDGWWSTSQGHKQHLSLARLRAIENRRSIARSANTGVSALINQRGDIEQSIDYGKKGSLKGKLATSTSRTFYSVHGDYIYRIAMLTLVIILLTSFTRRRGA